jgi:hypothetical protein
MIADLADVRNALQPASKTTAIHKVCDAVESLLPHPTPANDLNPTTNV